jgi:hypothetical protein
VVVAPTQVVESTTAEIEKVNPGDVTTVIVAVLEQFVAISVPVTV